MPGILEDNNKVSSTEANPVFTFKKAGEYNARLVVTDPEGESSEMTTSILVGNAMPELSWDFCRQSQLLLGWSAIGL